MADVVVKQGHSSAAQIGPTRNQDKDFGSGRARRHEPNMLPFKPMRVRAIASRKFNMTEAVETKHGVLPAVPRGVPVLARSGNNDPRAIGLDVPGDAWGIAGVGDEPAPSKSAPLVGFALLAGALFLGYKFLHRG